ncbi:La domain family [Drechmeria coniospora]|uniref:La domain family n=1 Tax=Drechmeria coniospora TaxID=98403 RepID=A0A151GFV8_DRECN|nr:La domain family [Drechmeria coniospora]KYK55985.1 La domain family [Drechmeria coniospora]
MAAPSTFSYAQAAKGQGAIPSSTTSSATPADAQGSQPTSSVAKTSISSGIPAEPASDPARFAEPRALALEKQEIDSSIGSESDLRSDATTEKQSDSKRDDDAGRLDRPWRRADKGTRSSSTTTRSVDEHETRKTRKSKKSKPSEKQTAEQTSAAGKDEEPVPEPPKVELSEAPIPSVNIWQQRKEAQQAKTKPSANAAEDVANGEPAHVEDVKTAAKAAGPAAPLAREAAAPNGVKPPRKTADVVRTERNGSRGSRLPDRDAKDAKSEVPPPVGDASSWPTPETAIKEEKKKPVTSPVERQEKEPKEAQDDSQKPRQKEKWVTYDYVPSVNFETQLPQMRNSKPRGGARGTNSNRAAAGTNAGDKVASNTPAAKPSESRDRPREAGAPANRATSLPPSAKRASMDGSSAKDQKKSPGHAAGDKTKDSAAPHQAEQAHGSRERPEGRGERGRAGFRGRGGHHSISTHSQHQHNGSVFPSGSVPSRPQGPYSPPPRQGAHGQMFMPPPQRGGRGRSGANFHRMSLPGGTSRLPPVQTQFGPYDYSMAPLSAVPFQPQPYWDNVVMSLLKNQIEYYFSIENLCKDMYLRQRMDSQGFVKLHFVAAFKRIRELTLDMGMIRAVCETSTELDFVVGEDDVERLRRRSAWQSFVMPMSERDDSARNDGPSHVTFKNRPFNYSPQFNGMAPPPHVASPPLGYNPQGEAQFPQFHDRPAVNGLVNGGGSSHGGATQLSAEVPDFSPSATAALGEPLGAGSAAGDKLAVDVEKDVKTKVTNGHVNEPAIALANGFHADEASG